MDSNRDGDLLWTFCGLSVNYILNVCCVEAARGLLELKYPERCFGCEHKDGERLPTAEFRRLHRRAVKEFYSLLALDNLTYREQLQGDIFNYMQEENRSAINPWGYFDFRLEKYQLLIERAVDNTLNQYLENQDYKKCLKLIGEAAINAEHRVKTLHVIFLPSGGFILLDQNNEILEADEINEELGTAVDLGLKLDDVLTAAFIYYAPEEIVVHNYSSCKNRVSAMVWDMAPSTVSFCEGCERCSKYTGPVFAEV